MTRTRRAARDTGVLERLVHGEVRVVELHVLADERDLHLLVLLADALGQLVPFRQVGRRGREPEPIADVRVEALRGEVLRHEVDVGEVG